MRKIAMLLENQFDDRELIYPYYRLQEEGFAVDLIGAKQDTIYKSKHGMPMKSDRASSDVKAEEYEAVVIPGGFSPDYMRRTQATIDFVKAMNNLRKPIAAICHAPWVVISATDLHNRKMTGFPTVRKDIENAGATYLDEEVVVDDNLITSRTPNDLPAFLKAIIAALQ